MDYGMDMDLVSIHPDPLLIVIHLLLLMKPLYYTNSLRLLALRGLQNLVSALGASTLEWAQQNQLRHWPHVRTLATPTNFTVKCYQLLQ